MSREIKFRAWDGHTMFEVGQITFNNGSWSVSEGRGVSIPFQPHITLMQFTGLQDKNGKDIYEGDIVKMISYNYQHMNNYHWQVIYHPESMAFKFYYQDAKKDCYEDIVGWHSFEIIGNIYETPSLIGEEKQKL